MFAWLMLAALVIESAMGWPDWLDQKIGHPVRWFGWTVVRLEVVTNRENTSRTGRIILGGCVSFFLIGVAATLGWIVAQIMPEGLAGFVASALIASTLVASRSLHDHVIAVSNSFLPTDLKPARNALSRIVGRETATLDEPAIARAAIESLAENTSDGVTAPIFWGVIFGLPGLFAYKATNTLDSMIGHRSERYEAFGKVAARLDDIANLIPARVTGILFGACALSSNAFLVMWHDANHHRSPNAGWPEAAMAGALGVRLSGPRRYSQAVTNDMWLNGNERDPDLSDLAQALSLYHRSIIAVAICLVLLGLASL